MSPRGVGRSLGAEIGKLADARSKKAVGTSGIDKLASNRVQKIENVAAPAIGSARALSKSPIVPGTLVLRRVSDNTRYVAGTNYTENATAGSFTNINIPNGTALAAYYSYYGAYGGGGGSSSGGGGIVLEGVGTGVAVVPVLGPLGVSFSNLGAGPTEFSAGIRVAVDLANAAAMRAVGNVTTVGAAGSVYAVQVSPDNGTSWFYADGGAGPTLPLGTLGWTRGGWAEVAGAYRGEVLLRVVGVGGNGVADPNVQQLSVQILEGTSGVRTRGDWSNIAVYLKDDLAEMAGSVWRALRANVGVSPVEGADWTVFAAKGDKGDDGDLAAYLDANGDLQISDFYVTPSGDLELV